MSTRRTGEAAIGDEAVREKTGRGWDDWFAILDAWGAAEKGHAPIARHLAEDHGLSPWWSQTVTVRYERERGLREIGQRGEAFVATGQRTVAAPAEAVYAALTEPGQLSRWFTREAEADLRVGGRYRNADGDRGEFLVLDPPHRLRFTWENPEHCPGTVVQADIVSKGPSKTTVRLEHAKLPDREGFEEMKEGWSWALDSLKSFLETGEGVDFEEWRARRTSS